MSMEDGAGIWGNDAIISFEVILDFEICNFFGTGLRPLDEGFL